MTFAPAAIRTIALVDQGGSGKTTLGEQLLARAGAIGAAGSIELRHHRLRFRSARKAQQAFHSMRRRAPRSAFGPSSNVDTTDAPDLVGSALCALEAVETAANVINAQNGV